MFVMGAPSTRIWPPEMSSSGSSMCGNCLRTSEMSKRRGRRFFFGNSRAPSGLDRTGDQAKRRSSGRAEEAGAAVLIAPVLERANNAGRRRPGVTESYSELKGTAPPPSSPVRGWSSSRGKAADDRRRARALDTGYRFGGHPRIIACSLPPAAEKRLSSPAIHPGDNYGRQYVIVRPACERPVILHGR